MLGRLLDRLLRRKPRPRRRSVREAGEVPTDWAQTRSPASQFELALLPLTEAWMARLPRRARPTFLAQRHVRLANRLALCWDDAPLAARVLDELILPRRGGRRGFSKEVAAELLALRDELARRERPTNRA